MRLLTIVERHLKKHAVPASRFGRAAAGDPRFVFDLRRGREPRASTIARVHSFIVATENESPRRSSAQDQEQN
jgi:hypothetical protein